MKYIEEILSSFLEALQKSGKIKDAQRFYDIIAKSGGRLLVLFALHESFKTGESFLTATISLTGSNYTVFGVKWDDFIESIYRTSESKDRALTIIDSLLDNIEDSKFCYTAHRSYTNLKDIYDGVAYEELVDSLLNYGLKVSPYGMTEASSNYSEHYNLYFNDISDLAEQAWSSMDLNIVFVNADEKSLERLKENNYFASYKPDYVVFEDGVDIPEDFYDIVKENCLQVINCRSIFDIKNALETIYITIFPEEILSKPYDEGEDIFKVSSITKEMNDEYDEMMNNVAEIIKERTKCENTISDKNEGGKFLKKTDSKQVSSNKNTTGRSVARPDKKSSSKERPINKWF